MFGKLGTGSKERISGIIPNVNRTIRKNQLPTEALGTFSCKPKILERVLEKQLYTG